MGECVHHRRHQKASQFSLTVIRRPLFGSIPSEQTHGSHSSHLILHSLYPFVPDRCLRALVCHSSAARDVLSSPARLSTLSLLYKWPFLLPPFFFLSSSSFSSIFFFSSYFSISLFFSFYFHHFFLLFLLCVFINIPGFRL